MKNATEAIVVGLATFVALLAVAFAQDELFQAHMTILTLVLGVSTIVLMRRVKFGNAYAVPGNGDSSKYMDGVIRYGVIATAFWGIAGFRIQVS